MGVGRRTFNIDIGQDSLTMRRTGSNQRVEFEVTFYLHPKKKHIEKASESDSLLVRIQEMLGSGAECLLVCRLDVSRNYAVLSNYELGMAFTKAFQACRTFELGKGQSRGFGGGKEEVDC